MSANDYYGGGGGGYQQPPQGGYQQQSYGQPDYSQQVCKKENNTTSISSLTLPFLFFVKVLIVLIITQNRVIILSNIPLHTPPTNREVPILLQDIRRTPKAATCHPNSQVMAPHPPTRDTVDHHHHIINNILIISHPTTKVTAVTSSILPSSRSTLLITTSKTASNININNKVDIPLMVVDSRVDTPVVRPQHIVAMRVSRHRRAPPPPTVVHLRPGVKGTADFWVPWVGPSPVVWGPTSWDIPAC